MDFGYLVHSQESMFSVLISTLENGLAVRSIPSFIELVFDLISWNVNK